MRVASWLKCPDSKLQRNSDPLLKLNSCKKKPGKKSPQFLGQVSVAPPLNAKSLPSNAASGSSPPFAVEFDQIITQRRSLMSPERQAFKSLPTIRRYSATLLDFQTASHAFTAPFLKRAVICRSNYWTPCGRLFHRGADISLHLRLTWRFSETPRPDSVASLTDVCNSQSQAEATHALNLFQPIRRRWKRD